MENVESQHEKLVSKSTFPFVVLFQCAIQRARDATTESKTIFQALTVYSQATDVSQSEIYPDLRSDQEKRGRGGENVCDLVP